MNSMTTKGTNRFAWVKIVALLILNSSHTFGQLLPSEWQGKWEGVCNIWSYNAKIDSFPMSLEILPRDSVWTFRLTYFRHKTNPDRRNYELIMVDKSKNRLAIDEKNGILLDSYFNDNCLYTRFGGLGSDLLTRMCVNDGELTYEITSSQAEPVRVSGNAIIEKDTIPEIKSYNLYNVMKARLKRRK